MGKLTLTPKSLAKLGDKNPMWKGDDVTSGTVHAWVRRRLTKPDTCPSCKTNPPRDIANICDTYNAETYTKDLANWRWLCRDCHMREDGRLAALRNRNRLSAKVSDKDVARIRELYATGTYYQRELASIYGLKQPHVSSIINYRKRK